MRSTSFTRSQTAGGDILSTDTLTGNNGVQQNLKWGGGSYAIGFNNNRQEQSDLFATRNPALNSSLTAAISQPLLRNFRTDAADLARRTNVDIVGAPLDRVVCWLDPAEMRSTWLGNKAVYRTRMAIADGGELVVLAPGVTRFGEDPAIDALIRRHGYRGTPATLDAVRGDPELAANLGAAAHLVHGSSEGRFRIVWCTDPTTGLTREEVESVGYEWRDLRDELDRLASAATPRQGDAPTRRAAPSSSSPTRRWASGRRLSASPDRSGWSLRRSLATGHDRVSGRAVR